jgi:hypothetical protein
MTLETCVDRAANSNNRERVDDVDSMVKVP